MTDALEDHQGSVSIGGRTITNLRFADDIDGIAGDEEELADLVRRLDETSTKYGMEISAEKTKMMTNKTTPIQTRISVSGQDLEQVHQFKYLGAIISEEGSKAEIISRAAQTAAAMGRLKPIWRDQFISLRTKVKLLRALVLSIFLYACESWTLTAALQRRIQAVETRCYRILLGISYLDRVKNEEIIKIIDEVTPHYEDLLTTIKKRKLRWYGHITRSTGLSKTILQGTTQGGRSQGRPKKKWADNIAEWTGLNFAETQALAHDRESWRKVVRSAAQCPYDHSRSWD